MSDPEPRGPGHGPVLAATWPRRPCGLTFHRLLVAGLLVGALVACDAVPGGDDALDIQVRDSAGVTIVEHPGAVLDEAPVLTLAPEPELRLGALDGPPELQFAAVFGGAVLDDGTVAVLDRQDRSIRLFDADGAFVRRMGREGEGPGEFRSPAMLVEDAEGALAVWDAGRRRVIRYAADGTLLSDEAPTRELPFGRPVSLRHLGDGEHLVVWEARADLALDDGDGTRQDTGMLLRMGADGAADSLAIFDGRVWTLQVTSSEEGMVSVMTGSPWYHPRLLSAIGPEGVWTSDGTRWEAVLRDGETGEVRRVVRFQREPDAFTQARIVAMYDSARARAEAAGRNPPDRDAYLGQGFPDVVPPVGGLFVDQSGRLWMGRQQVPPRNLPSAMGMEIPRWMVLDPSGEKLMGHVTLPPRGRLLDARDDGVLLLVLDDLDVPYVEWRRLEKG